MKNILIATDFSAIAANAAKYACNLAIDLKSQIILANTFLAPVEVPQSDLVCWPLYDYESILDGNEQELELLQAQLKQSLSVNGFVPGIDCISEMGPLPEALMEISSRRDIEMIVLGTHHKNAFESIIAGNHCRQVIDITTKPLLIIPPQTNYHPIKKIAFASDFKHPEADLEAIYDLISIARKLNADILLTHIQDEKYNGRVHFMKRMLIDLSNKANYPHIYYRIIKQQNIENGLDWLCEYGQVDILAMVHHQRGLLSQVFVGSHTQKMANQLVVPLMVFPAKA